MSARDVVPTISLNIDWPVPLVKIKLRFVSAVSLLTVELKVMLLSVVVNVVSAPRTTASL